MAKGFTDSTIDVSDLLALPKILKAIDPAAKKELTRGLRAIGRVIADGAIANVRAIPSKGTEGYHTAHGSIRGLVANAIKVKVTGMTVKVVQDRVGYPADAVSKLWELGGSNSRNSWDHPLFGDKSVQIHQEAHHYFMASVLEHDQEIHEAAEKAIYAGLKAAEQAAGGLHGK